MFGNWMGNASRQRQVDEMDPNEAQRLIRMYRAREQYMRNFGGPPQGGWRGGQVGYSPDMLLGRIRSAREQGWRPGQQWGEQ